MRSGCGTSGLAAAVLHIPGPFNEIMPVAPLLLAVFLLLFVLTFLLTFPAYFLC